ncbi:MAG TPA: hypothetical protein VN663_14270 [Ramlibacter sp.]|nr:hypothetical protein [Ramlibacter sp.]
MSDHESLRQAAQFPSPKTVVHTADLVALLNAYDELKVQAQPKRKAAAKKAAKEAAELPAWLPLEAWEAFLAMRVKIKKPATERAQKLILNDLERFRQRGMDPEAVLDQSTRKSWQDVYELKEQFPQHLDQRHTGRRQQTDRRQVIKESDTERAARRDRWGIPDLPPSSFDDEVIDASN